jgi:hypothetical protein
MIQHQCPRFHLYNAPAGHQGGCPVCAAQAVELARTRGVWGDPAEDADTTGTIEPGQLPPAGAARPTVGAYAHLDVAVDPVVGWLVCIAGPDKGRDWRLVSGRNGIGRGEDMAVRLAGDPSVSRDRHAVLGFDPRTGGFQLAPGDGQALVYCNGATVLVPLTLAAHDRIELGNSTLLFLPLVGPGFRWDD